MSASAESSEANLLKNLEDRAAMIEQHKKVIAFFFSFLNVCIRGNILSFIFLKMLDGEE